MLSAFSEAVVLLSVWCSGCYRVVKGYGSLLILKINLAGVFEALTFALRKTKRGTHRQFFSHSNQDVDTRGSVWFWRLKASVIFSNPDNQIVIF